MTTNRFNHLLKQGQLPVGHMLFEFCTRGIAQILEASGVDFVVIDMEHSSFTTSDVADMVAWLKATQVTPFVRIPQVEYHFVARALDAGVLGVVAPNVRTSAQARALVDAAKYPPLGKRGFFYGGANSDFRKGDPLRYVRDANENTTVICMIESPEGVDNVEEIAATTGVDGLWVGHWDLSQFMGIPGQFEDDAFRAALARVISTCRERKLAAIIQPGDLALLRQFLKIGFNAISYDADFYVYKAALADAVDQVRRIVGE